MEHWLKPRTASNKIVLWRWSCLSVFSKLEIYIYITCIFYGWIVEGYKYNLKYVKFSDWRHYFIGYHQIPSFFKVLKVSQRFVQNAFFFQEKHPTYIVSKKDKLVAHTQSHCLANTKTNDIKQRNRLILLGKLFEVGGWRVSVTHQLNSVTHRHIKHLFKTKQSR